MEYKVVAKVSSGRHVVSRLVLVPVTSHGSNATAFIVWVCRHGGLFTHQAHSPQLHCDAFMLMRVARGCRQ